MRQVLVLLDDSEPLTRDLHTAAAGLDSIGAVELLGLIESEYNIVIPDEQLTLESFATLAGIWDLVVSAGAEISSVGREG
jgi:acyl carrier protein